MTQPEIAFTAFISYSTHDRRIATWLQTRLEHYRLPSALRNLDRTGRLGKFFRDRSDAAGNSNLRDELRSGLARSKDLIVICSPEAAANECWVNQEIELFRELRPDGRILPIIASGDPPYCFPPALLGGGAEPLAPDLRENADGKDAAFLKLVAALTGREFDQLYQRHKRRQRGRLLTFGLSAAAVVAIGAFAAIQAPVNARNLATTLIARSVEEYARLDREPGADAERAARLALLASRLDPSTRNRETVRSILLGTVLRREANRGIESARRVELTSSGIGLAAVSLDGKRAAIVTTAATMEIHDLENNSQIARWAIAPGENVEDLIISQRGRFVFYTEGPRTARRHVIVRTADATKIGEIPMNFCVLYADLPAGTTCNGAVQARFSEDERFLAAYGFDAEIGDAMTAVAVVSTEDGAIVLAPDVSGLFPRRIEFSPDGRTIAAQMDDELILIEISSGARHRVEIPGLRCFSLGDFMTGFFVYDQQGDGLGLSAGGFSPTGAYRIESSQPSCGVGQIRFSGMTTDIADEVPEYQLPPILLDEEETPLVIDNHRNYVVARGWGSSPVLYSFESNETGVGRTKLLDLAEDGGDALAFAFNTRSELVAIYPNGNAVFRRLQRGNSDSIELPISTSSGNASQTRDGRIIASHSASGRTLVLSAANRFKLLFGGSEVEFDDLSNDVALQQNGIDFSPTGSFLVGHNSGGSQPLFDGATGRYLFDHGYAPSAAVALVVETGAPDFSQTVHQFCELAGERVINDGDVRALPALRALLGKDACLETNWLGLYFNSLG